MEVEELLADTQMALGSPTALGAMLSLNPYTYYYFTVRQ
jgi:hypothetical protein